MPQPTTTGSVSNTFGPVCAMGAASAGFFYMYAVNHSRSEWVDVLLDYCHHKRTQYSPMRTDAMVRNALKVLKVVPK
ncbi:unnamed protein product [Amoebophrya sp. A25]|nr:unnamed protein product [Amoebophrya sp. A25]|eukprot:GSA25T00003810001.1